MLKLIFKFYEIGGNQAKTVPRYLKNGKSEITRVFCGST